MDQKDPRPARSFARKARKSIMAINNTSISYKQMGLRNEQPNRQPFKAGKIKYRKSLELLEVLQKLYNFKKCNFLFTIHQNTCLLR